MTANGDNTKSQLAATFVGVDDAPVVALARLILKRARLSLPCATRAQALAIIRGIRPAPPKRTPQADEHTCPSELNKLYTQALKALGAYV
jgi:hypothetical protein